MEDRLQVVDRWECGSGDERDPPSTSGSQPDPTSPPAGAGPSVASAPSESASTSQLVASPENIDAIVQDHDTFGTDENEDSLDSMSTSMDDLMTQSTADSSFAQQQSRGGPEGPSAAASSSSSSSSLSRTLSVVETAETLSEVIELESCHPIKRKSSRSGYEGPDDETQEGLSRIKKQCVARESHPALDDEETMPGNEDSCPTGASEPRSIALVEITSYPAGPNERSKLIPDKANPPSEILNWVDTFGGWSHAERLLAIDQLISACQPTQVRHMLAVIEPQFQRDFIFLLPKELSLYVLSFLSPRDLLRAAQTCRYWRILCEDNLLWREKFREAGLMDHDFKETMRARARRASSTVYNFPYSPWKSSFMRQHKIEMNWRVRPVRQPKVLKGHDDHVITCLQFSDNRIVSGSDDNTLKVWSAVNGKCLRTLVGHTGGVWSSQMEGGTIVSGSTDRTLKVWNAETGACVHTLYGHTSTVRCMHLHKNRVVSGSRDATLRIWDIQTSECLHVLTGHVAAVRCVQYNGRLVVSGAYDYLVKVWNPDTEECLHTLSGHTNRVYSLQFDGIHVVSGSLDTSIRVWDVETGACKHALMGHQSLTSGMELRNNILVSGNADSTVKVWDITSGQCLQTLSGPNKHQSAVTCLQFNSKFVITSSDDGTVKLWDVKTGDFIRDLVALESGGSGGVVWRIRANSTKLVCAVGSRNGTEETKLMVLDFEANEANAIKQ
ncbi:F-box/WD repeat-containing protein 7-like [Tigriopus californicus]|uniref:F-box/WD repeat-containing protein 7-like n=1 Tax=Tigriopus californicus TaxID=6832 RepID=UPI0027DA0F2B|nr:F-box/WD repeat-containing protein 7-like [Tigriopus californicus]